MSTFSFCPGHHVVRVGGSSIGRRGVVVSPQGTASRARVLWTCTGSGELIEPAVRTWVRFEDLARNTNTAQALADTARHQERVTANAARRRARVLTFTRI